jgi:hypothetical protein
MRTVTLNLTTEDICTITARIGSMEKLYAAIGYLSTWSPEQYPYVTISWDRWCEESNDLIAVYLTADLNAPYDKRRHVMGANWRDDHYDFNS